MRKKIWLLREAGGLYTICEKKPSLDGGYLLYSTGPRAIVKGLCSIEIKKWFGLRRQLKRNTCIQGYFNVSFTPIKKKK